MRKQIFILFVITCFFPYRAFAILNLELTQGVSSAIPIAVVPFSDKPLPQDVAAIIQSDLQHSGRFKVVSTQKLKTIPHGVLEIKRDEFASLGTDNVVVGNVVSQVDGRYQVNFQLIDLYGSKNKTSLKLNQHYTVADRELRAIAHHISDLIFQQITGVRGVFSTKLAYILVQRAKDKPTRYVLEVADQDGFNAEPLLTSSEPIMSPAWSPNGRELAYVSFEKRRASIYLQNIVTGERALLSKFPGINGAPAWSPDGKKLALVLSKSGSPNIYMMDIASRKLDALTHDFYINTEPSWSPDGKKLLFTSNRSGGPQIYQLDLATKQISRVSYDGDYNARASYTRDGKFITLIHKVADIYNIGLLDLDSGTMRVLTTGAKDSASPSIAPNGSMILYDTVFKNDRTVLAMVSVDGRIQLVLPDRYGEAQDAAWSPFL